MKARTIEKECIERGIAEVREVGYTVFENVLTSDAAAHYRTLCKDSYERYARHYVSSARVGNFHGDSGVKLIYNLHNKSDDFLALIFDENVITVCDDLLRAGSYLDQEPWQIQQTQARGLVGECEAQQLHIDSRLPGTGHPLVLQFFWVLDEFGPRNGATRVVPRSHHQAAFAEPDTVYPDEVTLECPAGSLAVVDGSVWHGSGPKYSEEERWIIIGTYSRWFVKPSFDLTRNTPAELVSKLTDRQKEIMGFRSRAPKDEFTRVTRRSDIDEWDDGYQLPSGNE